jgi:CzcA family heavy metal efflux pump
MNPSHIAIRNPASVFILVLMIVTLGTFAYRNLPREAAPDIQIPLLIVTYPFPGASPEDVESLVTRKLELKLQNVDNLKEMKSTSAEGASTITLEFQLGFNVDDARTKVREKLDEVKPELPADVEDPVISEINFSEQPMLIVNLAGEVGLVALKDVADDMKDEIEAIPGILEVNRAGGLEREVHVYANPEQLRYHKISLNQLASAVEAENTTIPGGTLEMGPAKYLIRVPGEFERPDEINDVVVAAPGGVPVFVRDVARVEFGFQELTSRSRLDGEESVSLVVIKRSGENLLKIRDQVKEIVQRYAGRYDGRIRFTVLADQGTFVSRIVRDLENNIITGFILVATVLLVVMGLRSAMFVAAAIPLSFLLTLVAMQMMGFTLNFVVLFSLILALGMLVDNAIVVVENIYRHMQSGKPRVQSATDGISEVAIPVTTSTITTLVAFAPVIFMPGIVGEFMSYLPETLIVALTASLVVALIINPVLCSTLMRVRPKDLGVGDELAVVERSRILRGYRRVLRGALRWRAAVLLGAVAAFVGIFALYAATTLRHKGVEFFPTTEPDVANITIEAAGGAALQVSDDYVRRVERAVRPFDEQHSIDNYVSNIGQRQGFGSAQGSVATSHLSYLTLQFPDWEHRNRRPTAVMKELREQIKGIAGADVKLVAQQNGPPTGQPVNIEVRGQQFEPMLRVSEEIKRRIKDVPGLVNLTDDFDRSRPEIRVLIDREQAARVGLSTRDIAQTVRTAFNGRKVSEYRVGKDEYDIVVRLDERFRLQPTDLADLYLNTPAGGVVPLSELARVTTGPAYGAIKHIKLDRVITVSADAAEGSPGPVVLQRAQERLAGMALPEGISLKYTGEAEDLGEAQTFLEQAFLMALFLIFLVLVTQFNSIATPFIIMSSVILSLMGVFLGLMIHNLPFSVVMGGIGVISLAGVVVNNAIVLIDFINQLRKRGLSVDEAVVLAGMVRLRPVFLTAITTVLGLMPIALGMDIDFYRWPRVIVFGSEGGSFWLPMALATIYGLSVATVLTLVVVPVLYSSVESGKLFLAVLPGRVTARLARRHTQPIAVNPAAQDRSAD